MYKIHIFDFVSLFSVFLFLLHLKFLKMALDLYSAFALLQRCYAFFGHVRDVTWLLLWGTGQRMLGKNGKKKIPRRGEGNI